MKPIISKRLAAWQATHHQLLREDAPYRKRFYFYLAANAGLSCILAVFYLPFFGFRLFGPLANMAIILGLACICAAMTLWQFRYQRRSIRQYLASSRGI